MVRVPVLSMATTLAVPAASSAAPPLIRMPRRVAAPMAETIETGVEITSAQGQAITSSVKRAVDPGPWIIRSAATPPTASATAPAMTAGV